MALEKASLPPPFPYEVTKPCARRTPNTIDGLRRSIVSANGCKFSNGRAHTSTIAVLPDQWRFACLGEARCGSIGDRIDPASRLSTATRPDFRKMTRCPTRRSIGTSLELAPLLSMKRNWKLRGPVLYSHRTVESLFVNFSI